ncbi:protein deadpan-like [Anopheles albimanus]|uniref:BHLH domain-containing protein n=1 Tax=Anopheles albimanus TaxID=7167 RepID=A0A182FTU2_ANOAL|nr:protein deadpan-like [Anopheles albimanus]
MANPSKLNPNQQPRPEHQHHHHPQHGHPRQERQDYASSESYLRRIKAEIRKTNKPIMEKKRRARINHYLNDLKGLLLDAMKKDPVRHSKLEKADILDLTVKHLQDIERRRLSMAMAVDPSVPEKFASGYRECIDEISKYFDSLGTVDEGLKGRVRKHLERCLTFPPKLPAGPALGGLGFGGFSAGLSLPTVDDINNNGGAGLLNRTLANNLSLMFPGGAAAAAGGGGGGVGYPSHSTATASGLDLSFNPFPFFSPFQRSGSFPGYTPGTFPPEHDTGVERMEALEKRTKASVLATAPCSPPVSPSRDDRGSSSPAIDVSMRTPTGKTMELVEGTEQQLQQQQQQHHMERLLAIFPTPPSPEDRQRGDERFGKLGHHCDSSPFTVPSAASQQRRKLLLQPLKMNVYGLEESLNESDSNERAVPLEAEAEQDEKTTDRAGSESEEDDSLVVHRQGQPNRDQSGKDPAAGAGSGGEMWRPW